LAVFEKMPRLQEAALSSVLRQGRPGLRINEHLDYPGDLVFRHTCKMGLEGIVSKRLGSYYRSGPDPGLAQFKNPEHRR
jgi:ATP-dependent DNA ligase